MEDYKEKSFHAATDFRVGEAILYLVEKRQVATEVHYRNSDDLDRDELFLIRKFQINGIYLLNGFASYNYKVARREEERKVIQKFCDSYFHNYPGLA